MLARWTMPLARTAFRQKRFASTPKEVFTNIEDESDPKRASLFEYSWGSWLKDDAAEKEKRRTQFSIKGLNTVLSSILKPFEGSVLVQPSNNVNVIKSNLDVLKEGFSQIKQISSIHEGKHHRIYKLQLDNQESNLVLRIPYSLESPLYTERKIKSEAATMDFLTTKLELDVPRVLAYSGVADNVLGCPFMLLEHKDGDLLMKSWNPLIPGAINEEKSKEELMKVISPIAEFNSKVQTPTFNSFGSLYFKQDGFSHITEEPYEGESNEELKGRWVIGPTVEKAYYRNKVVPSEIIDQHVGPWKKEEPLKMVSDLANLELENLKQKGQEQAVAVYGKFAAVSDKLFDLKSKSIPNLEELLVPRLNVPDLDPMNVIVGEKKWFVDFEGSSIKPTLLTQYPRFVQYSGPKIFDLENDVENYSELDELSKQQYQYMFYRTRNQFYWELGLNEGNKKLLGIISPAVKLIKGAYLSALDLKATEDYLYVENGLVELSTMWPHYERSAIVLGKNPIEFTEKELESHETSYQEYQVLLSSMPFAATGGWIPQDMFIRLIEQKILVQKGSDYEIDREKILQ
ncbi:hypothetical protein OGAPHI_007197 [Ogataea philodendri]|uniref:Altered inheritance of mitochondria protein 9, mitochondrial n=1 Tax=Ogataea philodendri TaxID=1378263 RepID=A0A9P8NV83_9ASCO|nr:uncharacterized protein OGAPHI_007197 [Ogataea philodendri]KAH3659992.1 hypothetical protein OGAPHI_007197 [Ogataea philodendri]